MTAEKLSFEYNEKLAEMELSFIEHESVVNEHLKAMDLLLVEKSSLDATTDVAIQSLESKRVQRLNFITEFGSSIITAFPVAAPVAPFIPYLSVLIAGGAIADNRRKDSIIKNGNNGQP